MEYDFSGWASKNNIRCSDGRTILKDAFKQNDGEIVPLVWNHQHNGVENVLGHAMLENRNEGVYAYCSLNDTPNGQLTKSIVKHGDVLSLSIYANQLQQQGRDVVHGNIREVSIVLAGANPRAKINSVLAHSEEIEDDEAIMCFKDKIELFHADEEPVADDAPKEKENEKMADTKADDRTVKDVFDSMTEEQKNVCYFLMAQAEEAAKEGSDDETEEDKDMKHNVFDNDDRQEKNYLSHSDIQEIIADGKRYGSLKESFLAHTDGDAEVTPEGPGISYGITNIDYLFPDAQNISKTPDFYKRDTGWVSEVMRGVKHTPFSRVKSMYADITADAARAKGYIKGKQKKEEVIVALRRSTTPTTIYKKQKLDRDDVIDITDFDVVAWLKGEMRMMLDEEIARAVIVGDGRLAASEDKISETNIRPIWTDDDTYTIKKTIEIASDASESAIAKAIIRAAVKSRKDYKGSGNPTFFTTEDVLTDMLLLEDLNGRIIYDSVDKLATAMRVSKIVTVPVMENLTRTVSGVSHSLVGIIVNLSDYVIGADKGGAVSMFDDFDIDYNAQKYLIETRCSGALVTPKSAIAIELVAASEEEDEEDDDLDNGET